MAQWFGKSWIISLIWQLFLVVSRVGGIVGLDTTSGWSLELWYPGWKKKNTNHPRGTRINEKISTIFFFPRRNMFSKTFAEKVFFFLWEVTGWPEKVENFFGSFIHIITRYSLAHSLIIPYFSDRRPDWDHLNYRTSLGGIWGSKQCNCMVVLMGFPRNKSCIVWVGVISGSASTPPNRSRIRRGGRLWSFNKCTHRLTVWEACGETLRNTTYLCWILKSVFFWQNCVLGWGKMSIKHAMIYYKAYVEIFQFFEISLNLCFALTKAMATARFHWSPGPL